MANITSRLVKGTPLTHQEMDENFNGLNTEIQSTIIAVNNEVNARISTDSLLNSHITSNETAHDVATTATAGFMSATDKVKLDSIDQNISSYTHPETHPAAMIVQDSSNRMVTDIEKIEWNSKQEELVSGTNIKTINGLSILGAGNVELSGGADASTPVGTIGFFIKRRDSSNISSLPFLDNTWLPCNGGIVSQADYPELFNRLGYLNVIRGVQVGTGTSVTSIAYVNNRLFILRGVVSLSSSTDNGITWEQSITTNNTSISNRSFVYGNNEWVIFSGGSATKSASRSTDLVTWSDVAITSMTSSTTVTNAIYDGSKYIVVTAPGLIYSSTDLITWNNVSGSSASSFLAYKPGLYLVTGTNIVRSSTDGITWVVNTDTAGLGTSLTNWVYDGTGFLQRASWGIDSGYNYTTDGISFEKRVITNLYATSNTGIIYSGGVYSFITRYKDDITTAGLFTSTDAISWSETTGYFVSTTSLLVANEGVYYYANPSGSAYRMSDVNQLTSTVYNTETEFQLPTTVGIGTSTGGDSFGQHIKFIKAL